MSEPPAVDVLIAHDSGDLRSVEFLASALDGAGIRPQLLDQRAFDGAGGDPLAILNPVRVPAIAVGRQSVPDFLITLGQAAQRIERPPFLILLGRAGDGTAEKFGLSGEGVFDFRSGINENVVAGFVERVRWALGLPPDEFEVSKRAPIKQAPPTPNPPAAEASPDASPSWPSVSDIWPVLDGPAKTAIAQANAVAQERRAGQIHSEDLLIGLYRESGGPTAGILADKGLSDRAVGEIVAEQIPTINPAIALPNIPPLESPPALSTHTSEALARAFAAVRTARASRPIGTRELLFGLVSLEDCTVAERLRDAGITPDFVRAWLQPSEPEPSPPEQEPGPLATPEALAGFRSDSTSGKDLLNIGPEVDAIATVLAARTVQPPLALGLFGDWGTGKSFFMDRLERRIDQFSKAEASADRHGDERVYCRHIVQLKFNAWHYIDENLWASLANAIFEGLDDALTKRKLKVEDARQEDTRRADLILVQAQAQQQLEAARKGQVEADRAAAEAQAKVDGVDDLYDNLVEAVQPGAVAATALKVALDQPEVADAIKVQRDKVDKQVVAMAEQFGLEPDTLHEALAGRLPHGIVATWRALLDSRGRALWFPIAAVALSAIALTAILSAAGVDFAALFGVAAAVVAGALGPLKPLIDAARKVYEVMTQARAAGRKLAEEKREEVRKAALSEKAKADEEALRAAATVRQKEADFKNAVDNLATLKPGREMAEFVRTRQASNVYKSRLGVVARARDDFEELTRLLVREWPDPDPEGDSDEGPKPIERIILYIDDLDRVKEKEVVAVLQAVHLLLAFRLFVVVVAVDPRWLLHSLRVESSVFNADQQGLTDDEEDGFGWESTPLNYLEKIFQIPFALRPMGSDGFGAIVDNLVDYKPTTADDGANGHGTPATGAGVQPGDTSGNGTTPTDLQSTAKPLESRQEPVGGGETPAPVTTGSPAPSHAPDDGDEEEPRPVVMKPRALEINEHERLFMGQMHPLIGTPRGAKRFVNVYRLLKASHSVAEQGEFARPEVHRPVLLLLACLTGFPRETAEILRVLVEDEPAGPWWKFVIDFSEAAAKGAAGKDQLRKDSWEQFVAKLRQVQSPETAKLSCDDMRARARRVARYSFESSRILFMEAEDASSSKAPAAKKPRTVKAPVTKPNPRTVKARAP